MTFRAELAARLSGSRRRAALIGVAVLAALGLATAVTQGAGALPQPSIDQVQAKINSLTTQFNKADQQYDNAEQQLTAAKARLATVNKQLASEEAIYKSAQQKVVQIADSSYENSAQTSLAGLLASASPGQVLAEASIVLQLTNTRTLETQTFLTAATELSNVQQEQQRTEQGVASLAAQKSHTKNHILSAAQRPEGDPRLAHRTAAAAGRHRNVHRQRQHHRQVHRPDHDAGGRRRSRSSSPSSAARTSTARPARAPTASTARAW